MEAIFRIKIRNSVVVMLNVRWEHWICTWIHLLGILGKVQTEMKNPEVYI